MSFRTCTSIILVLLVVPQVFFAQDPPAPKPSGPIVELSLIVTDKGGFIRKSPRETAEKFLNTITAETGGRVFYPKTGPELMNATAEIITNLRSQFRVTYQSSHIGKTGFLKVDVKLISPNERNVITPRGYYIEGPSQSKERKSK